jgi:phosphatidylglycerophosphatase A
MTFDEPHQPEPAVAVPARPPAKASVRFMFSHPAHIIALGFGSGLSPFAPGTAGTLWAWVAFLVMQTYGMTDLQWAVVIALGLPIGWWASSVTAQHMGVLDPGNIVWDEIVAFWIVLWLVMPAGFWAQVVAFALFRYFDAAKPGPVGWADRLFHGMTAHSDPRAWTKAGFGILLDDLVAAGCTLMVIAIWRFM